MPIPRDKPMCTTMYADANLNCLVTGRPMSGIIYLINQTPAQWFCQKQNIVKTVSYGSEFMAARQAIEEIMDLSYSLCMMGIALDGPIWLFGDNQKCNNFFHYYQLQPFHKHQNALFYHKFMRLLLQKV
jgi:hypothetical protein